MESRLRRHFSRLNVRGAGSSPGVCTSHPEYVKQKRKLAATGDLAHIPCNRHAPAIQRSSIEIAMCQCLPLSLMQPRRLPWLLIRSTWIV